MYNSISLIIWYHNYSFKFICYSYRNADLCGGYFCSHQDGWSSLMLASEKGHKEVVKRLLSAGAQANLQNKVSITSPVQGPMVTCMIMLIGVDFWGRRD